MQRGHSNATQVRAESPRPVTQVKCFLGEPGAFTRTELD